MLPRKGKPDGSQGHKASRPTGLSGCRGEADLMRESPHSLQRSSCHQCRDQVYANSGRMEAPVEFGKLLLQTKLQPAGSSPGRERRRHQVRLDTPRHVPKPPECVLPLGVLPTRSGAITDEQLNRTSHARNRSHLRRPLDEFVLEMDVARLEKLSHASPRQFLFSERVRHGGRRLGPLAPATATGALSVPHRMAIRSTSQRKNIDLECLATQSDFTVSGQRRHDRNPQRRTREPWESTRRGSDEH
jgi:hypothetical protein